MPPENQFEPSPDRRIVYLQTHCLHASSQHYSHIFSFLLRFTKKVDLGDTAVILISLGQGLFAAPRDSQPHACRSWPRSSLIRNHSDNMMMSKTKLSDQEGSDIAMAEFIMEDLPHPFSGRLWSWEYLTSDDRTKRCRRHRRLAVLRGMASSLAWGSCSRTLIFSKCKERPTNIDAASG